MKTKRLFIYCLLVGTSFLASCSSDEMTDNQVEAVPEGMYPLQIASVSVTAESSAEPWGADVPQSRVAENEDRSGSVWQDGDKIKVQIGNGTPGTYTYQNGSLKVADGDAPAYWASKADGQTIRAWYTSSSDSETVDLSDQTNGLAYGVKAEKTANFNKSVSLTFSHALAKVRVELTGEIASFVDDVSIQSYTTCTFTQGMLSNGANEDEIKMYKVADKVFEANVYPGYQIKKVKVNNGAWDTLSASVTPEAAKIHKITIDVKNKNVETITLSGQPDVYTVESGKSVIIDGGGITLNKRIVINENAKVMLKNVKLADPYVSRIGTIDIIGTAMLLLSGYNEICGSYDGCPLLADGRNDGNSTLTINGTDKDSLKLVGGTQTFSGGCLGLMREENLIINGGNIVADESKGGGAGIGTYSRYSSDTCGSITINGGNIKAYGGWQSAGIGGSKPKWGCGDIIITGGYITAIGGLINGDRGGAGIGSAYEGTCGNITISGQNTVVTATSRSSSDDIGAGTDGGCGTVTITDDAKVTATNGRIHGH